MKSKTEETRFFYQLKEYGIKKFFCSFDFVVSFVVLVFLLIDKTLGTKAFLTGTDSSVVGIIAIASTLFAITLAALAIIFSFSSSSFVSYLRTNKKLSSILFLFWSGNASYLITIMFAFAYMILGEQFQYIKDWIHPFMISAFLYSLINTFYLLTTVIRFGYFLDFFESSTE